MSAAGSPFSWVLGWAAAALSAVSQTPNVRLRGGGGGEGRFQEQLHKRRLESCFSGRAWRLPNG